MIKGAVPGAKGGWVTLKDAVKKSVPSDLPYPTSTTPPLANNAKVKTTEAVEKKSVAIDAAITEVEDKTEIESNTDLGAKDEN